MKRPQPSKITKIAIYNVIIWQILTLMDVAQILVATSHTANNKDLKTHVYIPHIYASVTLLYV